MSLLAELRDLLGDGSVERPTAPFDDIAGFDLGVPAAVAHPSSTQDVARIVQIARRHRTPLVPMGHRTAYWGPLHLHGALAMTTHRLRGRSMRDGILSVGAGEAVRPLDRWLRTRGACLPVHPDAFGETGIGAMVATGMTSGIGMARGGVARWLTGLTVVTGTGERLHTGTAHGFEGTPPFLRDGLPDLTGLFLGSEGTLGVVTAVHLRIPPAPTLRRITGRTDDPIRLLTALRPWLEAEVFDTVRLVREWEPARQPDPPEWSLTAWTLAPGERPASPKLLTTLAHAGLRDAEVHTPAPEDHDGTDTDDNPRWQGPIGMHDRFMAAMRLVGLDVNAPWSTLDALVRIAEAQARDAQALHPNMIRSALYLAPDFVNLGLHTTVPRPEDVEACRAHQRRWLSALAALPVVPYRPGHSWPPDLLRRRRAPDLGVLRAVKQALDPDGLLNPTHPLFAP